MFWFCVFSKLLLFEADTFLQRLEGDWDRASTKKGWVHRDALTIHASCGGFNAICQQLKESVPQKDYQDSLPHLMEQFKLGILDGDIMTFLESTVPPVSLQQVPFVRTPISKLKKMLSNPLVLLLVFHVSLGPTPETRNMITAVEQRKLREAQQTERELAEKVSMATVEQMRHTFNKDLSILKGRVPDQSQIAKEAALDKKYLGERQKSFSIFM